MTSIASRHALLLALAFLGLTAAGVSGNARPPAGDAAPAAGAYIKRSGEYFKTPAAAAKAARDGDIVEILAGVYKEDVAVWKQDNLTLRGVNGRAHLAADGKAAEGKAIWVVKGDNVTIENIEFSGARATDRNGAGIRLEGAGLTIRNCYFHDNENGILGGHPQGDVLIEHSEFADNGTGDGRTHNMYIGKGRNFTLRHSRTHHARVGHNVKTRAAHNVIEDNVIYDGETGNSSYAIDVANGGTARIQRNLIQKGPRAENKTFIRYGAEGLKYPDNTLVIEDNVFIDDLPGGGRLYQAKGVEARFHGNVTAGGGGGG
ncbi:MAG: right-handed parallel beta-helix repeat-containing protein [Pseudomonadota bacterium]|nr:right-handed parallel beta-helix repeat-containing protein [Pseudomonadota bacterium]